MLFPDKDQLTWALDLLCFESGCLHSSGLRRSSEQITHRSVFLKAELENTPLEFADQSQVKYTSKNRFVTMLFPDKDQLTWALDLFCFESGVGVFTAPVCGDLPNRLHTGQFVFESGAGKYTFKVC